MSQPIFEFLKTEANHLSQAGLLREEIALASAQGATVRIGDQELLNLASSDYLGLANHAEVKKAAKAAIDKFGTGSGAPRMSGGTLEVHLELERAVAELVGAEDALVFPSGYQANAGIFESLLGDRDFVFCDEQCRPSLADGIRLSRARSYSYRNQDLAHLEDQLKRSRSARFRVIATDGVFATDGLPAKLVDLHRLAGQYDAIVVVDDSHGIGVLGTGGKGTHALFGITEEIDLVTGTFGYALGSAGGFVAGRSELVQWLRQRSRPYISSVALNPPSAAAARKAIELLGSSSTQWEKLQGNVRAFRQALTERGVPFIEGDHPAVAIRVGHAVAAQRMVDLLQQKGIFAIGFCHPVVPEGSARIRAQITAAHSKESLLKAAEQFAACAAELKLPNALKKGNYPIER